MLQINFFCFLFFSKIVACGGTKTEKEHVKILTICDELRFYFGQICRDLFAPCVFWAKLQEMFCPRPQLTCSVHFSGWVFNLLWVGVQLPSEGFLRRVAHALGPHTHKGVGESFSCRCNMLWFKGQREGGTSGSRGSPRPPPLPPRFVPNHSF